MKKLSITLIVAFSICFIGVRYCFGNGVYVDGIGTVSNSRGGTNIAHSDNGSVIHDNPSALTAIEGKRFEGNFDFLISPVHYQDPENDKDGKNHLFFLPSFSYSQKITRRPFGIGIGVFSPAGFSTEYRLNPPDLPNPGFLYGRQKYASDASLTKILMAAGWQITDKWSVGLGVGPAYSKASFQELHFFQTGPLAGAPVLIDMNGDDWAMAWNMGVQWRISESTTLGLAYVNQDRFHLSGDLDLRIDPAVIAGAGLPPLTNSTAHYHAKCDFQWPQTLGIGIRHQFQTKHTFSTDIVWIDWSSAFDELTFKLSDGDNSDLNTAVGGSSVQDTIPLHWKDSYAFRLGYEYLLAPADTLRLGYSYNQNPVPDSTLTPIIPGILTHMVSFGYGHDWDNWALNAAYVYSFGPRQSVSTSEIIGGDYDQSSVKVSAHFLSAGIQYQF